MQCYFLHSLASFGAAFALTVAIADAGTAPPQIAEAVATQKSDTDSFDKLWAIPTFINNPHAAFIQKLAITGRYHGQFYALDSDQGSDEDYDTRRLWIGADTTFLNKFRVKADAVLDGNDFDPVYQHLYEAYASYLHSDALTISFGRREPYFTHEFTSSKYSVTFERSLLVNQIHPENLAGLWVNGKLGDSGFGYDMAVYSGDLDDELGGFDAGYAYNLDLSYDFAKSTSADKSLLRLGYLANDGGERNTATRPYDHAFSLSHHGEWGKFGFRSDLLFATGLEETSDVWGVVLMPTYRITDKLEGVFRYQWANSDDENGINLQKRYERAAPNPASTFGDEYHAFYTGLNYYIYDHKLKLMTGVEYSTMVDSANDGGEFNGWTGFAGLRMYF